MDNNNGLSELMMAATGLREYFLTLVEAGFTEDQAMQLLVAELVAKRG